MFRPKRRIVLPLVAAYLLAMQLAMVAHDHQSHRFGTCCSARAIASKLQDHEADEHAGHDKHHGGHGHHHQHAADAARVGCDSANRGCGDESPKPDRPRPLHDDQCGACQFLALAQLAAPPVASLPQTGEVQTLQALLPPLVVSRITTNHPARGPPVTA